MASFDLMSSLFMREFGPPILDAPGDAEAFDESGYKLFGSHQEHARMLDVFLGPLAETPIPSAEHMQAAIEMMLTAAILPAKLAELYPSYVPTGAPPSMENQLHLIAMPTGHIEFVQASDRSTDRNDMLPIDGTMADYGFVPKLPPGFTWYVKREHFEYVAVSEPNWTTTLTVVLPGDEAPFEYKALAKAARDEISGQEFRPRDLYTVRVFANQWKLRVGRGQIENLYRVHIYTKEVKSDQTTQQQRGEFYRILMKQASFKPDTPSKKAHLELWTEINRLTHETELFDAEMELSFEEMHGDAAAFAQARDVINREYEVGLTHGPGAGQVRTLTRQSAGFRLRKAGDATITAWRSSQLAFDADSKQKRLYKRPHPFYDEAVAMKLREQIIATREFAAVVQGITQTLTSLAGNPSLRGIFDIYRRRAPDDTGTSRKGVPPSWVRFSSRHVWPHVRRTFGIVTFQWLRFPEISGHFRQASPLRGKWMPTTLMLTGTTIAFAAVFIWLISLVPSWIVSSAIYPFLHVFTTPAAMLTNVTPAAVTDDVMERVRTVIGTSQVQDMTWDQLKKFAMLSSKTEAIRQAGYDRVYHVAGKAAAAAAATIEKTNAETVAAAATRAAARAAAETPGIWGKLIGAESAAKAAADAATTAFNDATAAAGETLATQMNAQNAARMAAIPAYTVGDVTNLFRAPFSNVTMAGADFATIQQNIGHSTNFGSWIHMASSWFGVSTDRLKQLFTDPDIVGPEGSFLTDAQLRRTPNPMLDFLDKPWTIASPLGVTMTVGSTMLGLMVIKKNIGSPLTAISIAATAGIGVYVASWFHTELGKVLTTVGAFITTALNLQLPTYVTWSVAALLQMMVLSSQLYMITRVSKIIAERSLSRIRKTMISREKMPPVLIQPPQVVGGYERFLIATYNTQLSIPTQILGVAPARK